MTPEAHTAVLDAAQKRVDALEPRLAAIVETILHRAGDLAAKRFAEKATDHLNAAAANGDVSTAATMIALKPRPAEAAALAEDGGDPADILHCTLCFLGETDLPLTEIADAVKPVAASIGPLVGTVGGYGVFPDPANCGILLPDVRGLVEARVAVTEALVNAGIDFARNHGFQPHMTVTGADPDGTIPTPSESSMGHELHFDAIHVVRGNAEEIVLPLVGTKPLTAAGDVPDWSAPFPDELIDVDALVAEILAKTEPVRTEMIKQTMTPALEQAGLSWDVTNPLTDQVLATSASQVTSIADTTRVNVMRVVRASYQNGLSIPHTADAIREGMAAASKPRATMIARTELARAANAGSLAATQLVAAATGDGYSKTWQTAPGALYPRHEDYADLDGQTVGLDEPFDVGGEELQYPGDPGGDPGETINCRCSMSYGTPEGMMISDAEDVPDFADGEAVTGEGDGGGSGGLGLPPVSAGTVAAEGAVEGATTEAAPRTARARRPRPVRTPAHAVRNETNRLDPSGEDINAALASIGDHVNAPGAETDGPAVTANVVGNLTYGGVPIEGLFSPADRTIQVRRLTADRKAVFTHEYGHALDNMIANPELGDVYATAHGDAYGLRDWADTVKGTETYQSILTALNDAAAAARETEAGGLTPSSIIYVRGQAYTAEQLIYVLDAQELFARSFVQWMSLRDPGLARHVDEQLAQERQSVGQWYWHADEFAPVADAMTEFFRSRELLSE